MRKYIQLSLEQRYQISILLSENLLQKDIAERVGCSASTISTELKRNSVDGVYDAKIAHEISEKRRSKAKKSIKIIDEIKSKIEDGLNFELSPEQVSLEMWISHKIKVSHEWIYAYIKRQRAKGIKLYEKLRFKGRKRKKYGSESEKRGQLINRISIDERPKVVDDKSRIGDWEIDTVVGCHHKGFLVTIVERVTKFTLIRWVKHKYASDVMVATIRLLQPYLDRVHTITADNGKEFANHEQIAKALDTDVYFAHPYSSWERGLNENTNGLIRQYFPKGSSFLDITLEQVEHVMFRLNNRPRKALNGKTPSELFLGRKEMIIQ